MRFRIRLAPELSTQEDRANRSRRGAYELPLPPGVKITLGLHVKHHARLNRAVANRVLKFLSDWFEWIAQHQGLHITRGIIVDPAVAVACVCPRVVAPTATRNAVATCRVTVVTLINCAFVSSVARTSFGGFGSVAVGTAFSSTVENRWIDNLNAS